MKRILFFLLIFFTYALPGQNTWVIKASLPGATRLGAVSFSIGTKGYVGTGYGNPAGVVYDDFWEWDQATNTWMQKANLPGSARGWAMGFSIGTKGYIGTGSNLSNDLNDFWEWAQAGNVWTQKSSFYYASEAVGFSIGSKGYFGSGNSFWEYDPSGDNWTQKAPYPGAAQNGAVGFSIGSKGYIGTGEGPLSAEKDFWEYDPATDSWTQKADFGGGARLAAAAFSIGAKGYVGTGWDVHYNTYKDLWEYDPALDTWTQRASMTGSGRVVATGFSIGSKGYIGMGYVNGSVKDLREYTPGPLGVEDYSTELASGIFPNPANEAVTLSFENPEGNIAITIHDLQGKIIYSENLNSFSASVKIDVSEWPDGLYIAEAVNGNKKATARILVAH
jgi:hypothetical protein